MKMSVWSLAGNKAYFSSITAKNIYQSFTHKMAAKASWHWNYVTVTLCIRARCHQISELNREQRTCLTNGAVIQQGCVQQQDRCGSVSASGGTGCCCCSCCGCEVARLIRRRMPCRRLALYMEFYDGLRLPSSVVVALMPSSARAINK